MALNFLIILACFLLSPRRLPEYLKKVFPFVFVMLTKNKRPKLNENYTIGTSLINYACCILFIRLVLIFKACDDCKKEEFFAGYVLLFHCPSRPS